MSVTVKVQSPTIGMRALAVRVTGARVRVAVLVAHQLHHDAVFEAPRPPIEKGDLRGSGKVEALTDGARVSFNRPYALRLHEVSEAAAAGWPSKKIDPASGPKYLEEKTVRNADKYNRLAAEAMGEQLS